MVVHKNQRTAAIVDITIPSDDILEIRNMKSLRKELEKTQKMKTKVISMAVVSL